MQATRRKAAAIVPTIVGVVLVVAALYFAREILIPIALAILLTFLLAPLCTRLERLRLPRVAAVVLVMLGVTTLLAGITWLIQDQAYQLVTKLPEYKTSIIHKLHDFRASHGRLFGEASQAIAEVGREIAAPTPAAPSDAAPTPPQPTPVKVVEVPTPPFEYARGLFGPLIGPASTTIIVFVFTIFMLLKREDVRDRLIKLMGERSVHLTTPAIDDAAQRVSRYLRVQTAVNAGVGILIGLGLFFLGVPGALVFGILTALLRYIPYVGSWVSALFPVALSLAIAPNFTQPLLVGALFAVVELTAGQFVEPLVFSSHTGVSSIAILASALFWTWLWGPIGLLLATPLTVCLTVLGRHIPALAFLNTLLGDSVALSPETRLYQRLLAGDQEEAARIVDESRAAATADRFDSLLLPTLRLAETDRHHHQLDEDQSRAVTDLMSVLIEDLSSRPTAAPPDAPAIACIASRDTADELASRMLESLLAASGFRVESIAADSLTGETIERIAALSPAAVCISALPPAAALHARVLCKRLRRRFPDLPIVVGLWDNALPPAEARARLGDLGTEYTVTTLAQALATLDALLPRQSRPATEAPETPVTLRATRLVGGPSTVPESTGAAVPAARPRPA